MSNEKHFKQVRCIAFPSPDEGSKWCAVALEMDIWGFGNTAEEAMSDLDELIKTQIEFAAGKKKLSILDHPTDRKWFELWDKLQEIKEIKIPQIITQKKPSSNFSPSFLEKSECYFRAA